jgi:D-alanyl-D-alanine carboxypeptidase (penicillin-binding protein 5/6)
MIHDFPEYYPLYSTLDYTYNNIKQGNRNRLLTMDASVDGIKTGHTDAAGWCLVSSAKRDGRRVVSVLLGAPSENGRIESSRALINYGFNAYENVKLAAAGESLAQPAVYKGAAASVSLGVAADAFVLTVPRGQGAKLAREIVVVTPVIAPRARPAAGHAEGDARRPAAGRISAGGADGRRRRRILPPHLGHHRLWFGF